jgi:hypothetical protein
MVSFYPIIFSPVKKLVLSFFYLAVSVGLSSLIIYGIITDNVQLVLYTTISMLIFICLILFIVRIIDRYWIEENLHLLT